MKCKGLVKVTVKGGKWNFNQVQALNLQPYYYTVRPLYFYFENVTFQNLNQPYLMM